jgi:hypothetical protein
MADDAGVTLRAPEGRAELESGFKDLRAALAQRSVLLGAKLTINLDRTFARLALPEQARLLANPLVWDHDDQLLSERILDSHKKLADNARVLADLCVREMAPEDPMVSQVIALALLHAGSARKWEQIANQMGNGGNVAGLHRLFKLASRLGVERIIQVFPIGDHEAKATIEGLFIRALLLKRLCGGNLTRQQLEILDHWLWAWLPALTLTNDAGAAGASLCADLTSDFGFGLSIATEGAVPIYLSIAALQRQLRRAVQFFHRGEIYPGWGLATDFRVEEHIGVIDYLRREFSLIEQGATANRAERTHVNDLAVEVYVGFNDVLTRAFPDLSVWTPQHDGVTGVINQDQSRPAQSNTLLGTQAGTHIGARQNAFDQVYQQERRKMRLKDYNESGLGLVALRSAAAITPGDLIAIKLDPGQPCVLGEVVRKAPADTAAEVLLGVSILSRRVQRLTLDAARDSDGRAQKNGVLFLLGADPLGTGDAFIVSQAVLQAKVALSTVDHGDRFTFTLVRQKRTGRGWGLSGFDVRSEPEH